MACSEPPRRGVSDRRIAYAGGAALALALIIGPGLLGTYRLYFLNLVLVNVVIATGLNLLTGNAGQISMCHSSFMAIGAYATTLLHGAGGLSFWLALPAGAAIAAVFGAGVGLPAIRLGGFYLALATLGFLEVMQVLIQEFPAVTGGIRGMMAPRPTLFGRPLATDLSLYYPVLGITVAMLLVARNLLRSPVGRAFNAIRNSEPAAQALGIPVARVKMLAFTLAAFYAGIGGGLYAAVVGFIDPVEFGIWTSVRHIIFIVVGGAGSLAGSVIGAFVVTGLPEWLRALQEYSDFVYGGLLLAFLIFMPKGIVGGWAQVRARLRSASPAELAGSAAPPR
jgi:branched-chain amino acid transport system permease protein